jgi:predicted metallo-beta-lactamase superfamily hydrolase
MQQQKTYKMDTVKMNEIFAMGFGKVKVCSVGDNGVDVVYHQNPNMSQSQRKVSDTFVVDISNDERLIAGANQIQFQLAESRRVKFTPSQFASLVAAKLGLAISHESKSGSAYITFQKDLHTHTIRFSDHHILDRDSMNPMVRHSIELIQGSFTQSDVDSFELSSFDF